MIISCLTSILLLLLTGASSRPWSPEEVNVIETTSPLLKTIDNVSTTLARTLKVISPTLSPVLSAATLGYLGYIASVMFFPTQLSEVGLPLLKDFESKSSRTSDTGYIDSLATGILKEMIGRTEAADVLKNTSLAALTDGMRTLKRSARIIDSGLGSAQEVLRNALTALKPECISKYMCRVGQFTSYHVPLLGPMLRTINTFDLDEFSQALIDGTTIGDCSAVFFQCPL